MCPSDTVALVLNYKQHGRQRTADLSTQQKLPLESKRLEMATVGKKTSVLLSVEMLTVGDRATSMAAFQQLKCHCNILL